MEIPLWWSLHELLRLVLRGILRLPLILVQGMPVKNLNIQPLRKVSPDTITVAIFCSDSHEAVAVKYCLDEEFTCHPATIGPKDYVYSFGRIGHHRLVIAQPLQKGTVKAAHCAATVRQQFTNVEYAFMVGTGAGIPCPPKRDIRLGDIAIGIPGDNHPGIVEYDFLKYEQNRFVLKGCANKPPSILISADRSLQEDELMQRSALNDILGDITKHPGYVRPSMDDVLYEDSFSHIETGHDCTACEQSDFKKLVFRSPRPSVQPAIHRGLILSGNGVIRNARDRKNLQHGHDNAICFEMEAAGIADEIPCLVVRGICDYADTHKQDGWQRFAAAAAAAYCKTILLKIDAQELGGTNESGISLDATYGQLRLIGNMIQRQGLATVLWPFRYSAPTGTYSGGVTYNKEWTDLIRLPIAKDASFDSYAGQHEPVCLPGTRIGILQLIEDWVCDERGRCVFYLSGMAGTGKSTISRTVVKHFKEKQILGASFFFKRDAGDRGRLFSTIARQLMTHLPQLSPIIMEAVREDPDLSTKSLREQFERLLLSPLMELGRTGKDHTTIVIVIDALDECESDKDVQLIVRLLFQLRDSGVVCPRIFLSSRSELPVRQAFSYIAADEYHDFSLQEVPRPTIEHDMSLFLKHKIAETRNANKLPSNWPLDQDFRKLVTLCVPSFAFAAAFCTTLEDPQWDPEEVLSEFLQTPSIGPKLDDIYLPILNRILHGQTNTQQERLLRECKEVVGSILILQRPLSIESLSGLIGHSEKLIKRRLNLLHSIIDVPDDDILPVEPLHWSLQACLLSPELREMTPFWIDEKEMHNKLTIQCLKLMQCTFEKGIHHSLPALALQYACQYWVHHLSNSTDPVHQLDTFFPFLQEHFFHWVQIMSVFSDRSTITDMVDRLQSVKPVGYPDALVCNTTDHVSGQGS